MCIHALRLCHAGLAGSPRSSSSGPPSLELLLGRQIGRGSHGRVHASIFRGRKVAVKARSWVSWLVLCVAHAWLMQLLLSKRQG